MKKFIFLLFTFVLPFYFLIPSKVFAAENFITDYKVTYNVLDSAITRVVFDVTLTNKTQQYYASSYSIQVGFGEVENVIASDADGKIIPKVTKNDDGSNIELNFNKKVVGIDNKLDFKVSFDTKDIAQKSGKVWDINIPGLAKQLEYNSFDVNVIVPKHLEKPSYIKPDIGKFVGTNLSFTKEQLGESGISIGFGNEEIYGFSLSYHLKNSNLFPIRTEIALPPSTNYQEVQINEINPRPLNVIEDEDGNWLALYALTPSQELDITVEGKVKIMLRPKKEILSKDELKDYLEEQPYWETTNKEIKELAQKLKTPYEIYKYTVENLNYDFSRVQENQARLGALQTLKNPTSAVCLEFTDLFVALARAAGIPAREVNGFAYTQNSKERPLSLVKDVLHAWPEYYDEDIQTWVMVDPTWGNTTGGVDYFYTLDFDHFAFAIKGKDSTYPIPAGGYKISSDQKTKDIHVEFFENFESSSEQLLFNEDFKDSYFSGAGIKGTVTIRNAGNTISSAQPLEVSSEFLEPKNQKIYFSQIPPFGFVEIPVGFSKPSLLTNKTDTIRIAISQNYISKDLRVSPFALNRWIIIGGISSVSFIIGLSILAYKSRNLPFLRRKRENSLHREGEKPEEKS